MGYSTENRREFINSLGPLLDIIFKNFKGDKNLANMTSSLNKKIKIHFGPWSIYVYEGWTGIGIRCTLLWDYVELFWNSLDNASSSIVFYLEMKVEAELGVQDIRSRFIPIWYIFFGKISRLSFSESGLLCSSDIM